MNRAVSAETTRWLEAGRQALVSGSLASILSTAVLAIMGKRRLGRAAAPTNATSHWLWGDADAYRARAPDWRHTVVGYATHHASAFMWALLYERWLATERDSKPLTIVRDAALMTALAAFVDYGMTPRRLRPGFETHLKQSDLVAVFAAIGVGLAAGAFLNRRHERTMERLKVLR